MNSPKLIKTWEELAQEKSPTHVLVIDVEMGCGWIEPNSDNTDVEAPFYYLSTHTFYAGFNEASTKTLQACGFNVELANWDELGW